MPSETARGTSRAATGATPRHRWSLAGDVASLQGGADAPSARVDLGHPGAGLMVVPPGPAPGHGAAALHDAALAPDHLLGLDLRGPARLADHWIRGGDLAATYEPGDGRSLRATAMWRPLGAELGATEGLRAWEVIVSAQTALLHADAGLAVACDLRAAEVAWGTLAAPGPAGRVAWSVIANERWAPHARAVLMRQPAASATAASSVVVAVHADDGLGIAAWLADGRARVECRLFGDALEKGVLLRSRVLAAVGPATDDTAWADRLVRAYLALPPMLDT
jgi:hypothetical protein